MVSDGIELSEIKVLKKMIILSLKDLLKKTKLKNDTKIESAIQNYTTIPYIPLIQKYIQIKDLQISIKENKVVLFGHVFIQKITNCFTLIVSEALLMNFDSPNYQNQ